jgi:hypothetical protein
MSDTDLQLLVTRPDRMLQEYYLDTDR